MSLSPTFTRENIRILLRLSFERALQSQVERRSRFWSLQGPRIWYEPSPFKEERDIIAYRRFELSAVPLAGAGDWGSRRYRDRVLFRVHRGILSLTRHWMLPSDRSVLSVLRRSLEGNRGRKAPWPMITAATKRFVTLRTFLRD